MKYVALVRKMLGIRTIFNIPGPLTNPAAATMQVMGVYEEAPLSARWQKFSSILVSNAAWLSTARTASMKFP